MNRDKRRGDITDAGMILLLLAGVAFGAAAVGHSVGFDSGVLAHAEGRYVVVELPDGSKVVCENKKETKP